MPSHDDNTSPMPPPTLAPTHRYARSDQGESGVHRLRLPRRPDHKGHAHDTDFTPPGNIDACAAGFVPTFMPQTCVVDNGGALPTLACTPN